MTFYLVGLGGVWIIGQDLGVSVDTFPERINLGKMQPGCGQELPPIGGGGTDVMIESGRGWGDVHSAASLSASWPPMCLLCLILSTAVH